MRAVVQRVSRASVAVDGAERSAVSGGLLVYLGVDRDDGEADVAYLAEKVRHVRIFPDGADKMNLDVGQAGGKVLVVSAFTVEGDARRGRRPTFESAADPERAFIFYEMFCEALTRAGIAVEKGSFGSFMEVESVNLGPVCILLESRRAF